MNQKHLIKILSTVVLCTVIVAVIYYKNRHTNESSMLYAQNQHRQFAQNKFDILQYEPIFCKINDFIKIGVKIASSESQYRAPYKGTMRFQGNKKHYNANNIICYIENQELKYNVEHEKAKYEYAQYMFNHAKTSKQKSDYAITDHALKELEAEKNKSYASFKSAQARYDICTIYAPYDCSLMYPMAEDKTLITDNQYIFSTISKSKKAQGQMPIILKSMHNVQDNDPIQIIDNNGNIFYTKINHINDVTNTTQGSVYFESENLKIDDNQHVSNIGTALIYKKQELRCIVPEEHVYHGCSLVKTQDNIIKKRKCFVLQDGRYTLDITAGESIIVPKDGLNRKNIDDILNTDIENITVTAQEQYIKDDTDHVFTKLGFALYQAQQQKNVDEIDKMEQETQYVSDAENRDSEDSIDQGDDE